MKLSLKKWTRPTIDRADIERQAAEELDRQVGRGMPAPDEWQDLEARLASISSEPVSQPEPVPVVDAEPESVPVVDAEPASDEVVAQVEPPVAKPRAKRPAASRSTASKAKPASSRTRKPAAKPTAK